ncbi:MAG: hypothetical protein ACRC2K_03390, partial [Clostridium sp.]
MDDKTPIYEVIKNNSKDGRVDKYMVEFLLNPPNGEIIISSGFMDKFFYGDEEENSKEVICIVLEKILSDELKDSDEVLKAFEEVRFKTSIKIEELLHLISTKYFEEKFYIIFKEIIYKTQDKELLKLALEITGAFENSMELLNDYLLIGQVEEFSKYVSNSLIYWRDRKEVMDMLFNLLELTSDWGSINIAENLISLKDVTSSLDNQVRILIGALKDNCIELEIAYNLAKKLDLLELMKRGKVDSILTKYLIKEFYTLFFETEPLGG